MKKGFTLIEMLLVLIILAGATSLVFPYLSGMYEKTRFKAQVREISALFRKVRTTAIVQKKIFCIQIDLEEKVARYGIYEGARFEEKGPSIRYELPESIKQVSYFADGREYFTGKVWFVFYALGNSGGGELRFYGPKRHAFDMSLKPVTGAIILHEKRI